MNTTDTIKTMNDMTTKNVERMNSFGELGMRAAEKMLARQMDAMNFYMDHSMQLMKLATESKGYNDFLKGQVEAAKSLSERLMDEGKASMQLMGEVREDYRAWFEKNLADVSTDLRKNVATV